MGGAKIVAPPSLYDRQTEGHPDSLDDPSDVSSQHAERHSTQSTRHSDEDD